ncbi:MAG TPA: alpha/beta hydrolase-fold protein [Polyangiaceae bacterium]|nr:alpha/beta hydrolase-fold protein [Polyangiaceae bacterium]
MHRPPAPRRLCRPLALGAAALLAACSGGGTPAGSGGGAPGSGSAAAAPAARALVSLKPGLAPGKLDGRLLLFLSKDSSKEPRFQIVDGVSTQQAFGTDVEGWAEGAEARFEGNELGYPLRAWAEVPAGDYWVQALLHVYDTFTMGDGRVLKLPPDRGEGQQWQLAPGNLYSAPKPMRVEPGQPLRVTLDQKIGPIKPPADSKYVKHLRYKSELLSRFWGRPVELGAIVVLPEGFDAHPEARYPLAIYHGHFQPTVSGFREAPPDPALPPPDRAALAKLCPNGHEGEACDKHGYERVQQEAGHAFFREWTGPNFPRVILLTIQHANPFYDDSYAVNSANLGPYGDAITNELIPYIEKEFRGLGPWARALYGGSTGGWEALAAQIFYPDLYNGAYANCPDPIDFRAYTVVNIYDDKNAYYKEGPWRKDARPGERDYLGHVRATLEDVNRRELVLGTKGRSGGQWDIWEAVYSPVGPDGYPARIWDKATGAIDPKVAAHWREHYDLGDILRRNWATLGPKLRGKIHLNVGLSDNFFLNNAVYLVEDFLRSASPPADAAVDYGPRDEHCWSGDHQEPNVFSRLTYHRRFLRQMAEHWTKTAPPGADTKSWRY